MERHPLQTIEHEGSWFRDLDHDGVVSPFEDWRRTPRERADDLLPRLSIEEKVGLMLHGTAPSTDPVLGAIGAGTAYDVDAAGELIRVAAVSSMITRLAVPPEELAIQNNRLQDIAAAGRFGIPVSISSDPRHHLNATFGSGVSSTGFSAWPGTLGLGAIGEREVVRTFGEIVAREYRAVGIHVALSPQADLSTEPRWPRCDGTFGEDPALVRALVGAYVEGAQGGRDGLTRAGVATVVKHWVGYGASRDGFDGHNHYGRFSAFPGGSFGDHVAAFLDAFEFGVAGVMPTYNILEGLVLDGTPVEAVGAGFNRQLLTDLLRGAHGFRGVIISDWSITRDLSEAAITGSPPQRPDQIAMPWGVEELTRLERYAKGINAGLDQIGGENDPRPLLDAVASGLIEERRIDESARRILEQKFMLGLFEDPYVDPARAARVVGCEEHRLAGRSAQRRSLTLLTCDRPAGAPVLSPGEQITVHGIDHPAAVADGATAVVRVAAPFETLHPGHFFGNRQHEGRLDHPSDHDDVVTLAAARSAGLRTIAVLAMDRPVIPTTITPIADVIVVDFGASDEELLAALRGDDGLDGRLPFELPSSMDAVERQHCDRPADSDAPAFALFHRAGS